MLKLSWNECVCVCVCGRCMVCGMPGCGDVNARRNCRKGVGVLLLYSLACDVQNTFILTALCIFY